MLGLWKLRSWLPSKKNMRVFFFFGNCSFRRNKTQTAVINMEIKRILGNKIHCSRSCFNKRNVKLMNFVFQHAFHCRVSFTAVWVLFLKKHFVIFLAIQIGKLMSVFHASVLLLIMNFVITLSNFLWIAEWTIL